MYIYICIYIDLYTYRQRNREACVWERVSAPVHCRSTIPSEREQLCVRERECVCMCKYVYVCLYMYV